MSGTKQAVTLDHLRSLASRTETRVSEVAETAVEAIEEVARLLSAEMTGATSAAAGTKGMVPAPAANDDVKFLRGDGTWATPSAGGAAFRVSAADPSDNSVIWIKAQSLS